MGCGCSNKRDVAAYVDESKSLPASAMALKKPEATLTGLNTTSMNNLPLVPAGVLDFSTCEQNKCMGCEDTKQKKNTLDCSHGLCIPCTRQQLGIQLKRRKGNIEFFCRTCHAPKGLSIHRC